MYNLQQNYLVLFFFRILMLADSRCAPTGRGSNSAGLHTLPRPPQTFVSVGGGGGAPSAPPRRGSSAAGASLVGAGSSGESSESAALGVLLAATAYLRSCAALPAAVDPSPHRRAARVLALLARRGNI